MPTEEESNAQYLGSCLSLLWTIGSCSTHEANRELSWLRAPPEWASRILSDGCRSNAPERIRRVMARVVSKGNPVASLDQQGEAEFRTRNEQCDAVGAVETYLKDVSVLDVGSVVHLLVPDSV